MGQANSRGTSDRLRHHTQPASWAAMPESSRDDGPSPEVSPAAPPVQPDPHQPADPPRFHPQNTVSSLVPDAASSASTSPPDRVHRRSRTARARHSLSSIPSFFHRRPSTASRLPFASASRSRPSTTPNPTLQTAPSLPHVALPDLSLSFESASPSPLTTIRRESRTGSLRRERGLRSINPLRRRRSREEDEVAVLSRLLSTAARATAASLMANHRSMVGREGDPAAEGSREAEDGTFDSFLQALQSGSIASALRQTGSDGGEGAEHATGPSRPFNFFRMFRFNYIRDGTASGMPPNSPSEPPAATGVDSRPEDGRLVPIIIVGIRAIQPGHAGQGTNAFPFLDVLSGIPAPEAPRDDSTFEGLQQTTNNGPANRRRASMGGVNSLPTTTDNEGHVPSPERLRPWSTLADSPSGPLPPPTTPASSGLSARSSGVTTPIVSTSPSSGLQSPTPSRLATGESTGAEERTFRPRTARRRRMSESDFTRFGSGSSRRNGVVEPDNSGGSRSWIIYVLGGSYPEDHPLVTAPSLFTESPTYEDLLLLSSIIGPAKAPVASEEDVAAAPGLYKIRDVSGRLRAEVEDGADDESQGIDLLPEQTCQVCLCNFEVDEQARKLVECGHLFHRTCIEQWLTTGRNSCPLCRAPGVAEQAPNQPRSGDVLDPAQTAELA